MSLAPTNERDLVDALGTVHEVASATARIVSLVPSITELLFDLGLQSQVANAASDLLIGVLGDNGRHARTAIGVAGLPRRSPVEIQMVCTEA